MRDVMSPSIATVGPSTPVGDAHRLLREHRISHLPVLDGRTLAGFVRAVDVLETAWDRAKS